MRTNQFLLVVMLALMLTTTSLAQTDSSQAELGLDFLIGRIIGGYGFGGNVFYNQEKSSHFKSNRFSLIPSFIYGKKNLFQFTTNYSIISYDEKEYNSKYNYFFSNIQYRPMNSLHFNITNNYNFSKTDYSQNSSRQRSSRQYTLNFDVSYLSRNGYVKYNSQLAKWWYYLFPTKTYYSTYYQVYALSPPYNGLPSVVFLNSNQLYCRGFFRYIYDKDKHNFGGYNYSSKHYSYHQNKHLYLVIYYALFDKFFLQQQGSYSDSPSSQNSFSSNQNYDPETQKYSMTTKKGEGEDNRKSYHYKASINFLASKHLLNRFQFTWDKYKSDGYHNYENTDISVPQLMNSKTNELGESYLWVYDIQYLNGTRPISYLKILSDYSDYYGHLLSKGALKIDNQFSFSNRKDRYEYSYLDTSNTTEFFLRRSLSKRLQNTTTISYGLTDKLNLKFNLSISHGYSSRLFDFDNSNGYQNSTAISEQISLSYYSYTFNKANKKHITWLNLSDFDYWQGPMLKKGMSKICPYIKLPKFSTDWISNRGEFFKFHWDKLRSNKGYGFGFSSGHGLKNNLELDINSSFYRSKRTSAYYYGVYSLFYETQEHFYFDLQLKWQINDHSRFTISYRLMRSKSKETREDIEHKSKWDSHFLYFNYKILL